jgi:F-type H+-transporting ATPase subunit delta
MADRPETGRVDVYARALLDLASAEGHLDEVEDELFRFARIVEGNDDLRMTLANPGMPLDRRAAIVDELLDNRALPLTKAIAAFVVGAGRGHDLPAIVDRFVALAAAGREHAVAEVRSAVALDDQQRQRIATALSRATRKNVEVKVIVDESVMGGIVATIGDTVIDGTVRHRLDQLKEQI